MPISFKPMKLLMITRKVDHQDALAGFTYNWVKKIGENVTELKVICLEKGDVAGLPGNVSIYSLGKENGVGKFIRFWRFQNLAFKLVPQVDGIFCHMNPEYTIAVGLSAKLFHKKIVSWYTHGAVTFRLKLLEKIADVILTASKESFRLPSKKVIVVGHGIDAEIFKPGETAPDDSSFNLLTVGRISPTKDYESMIKALDFLKDEGINNVKLKIIGDAGLQNQQDYFDSLKTMVKKMNLDNQVEFIGALPNPEIPNQLQQASCFINLSGTGSLDKAILEAMACGCLVLTSNEAFNSILPAELMVAKNNPRQLADKIKWLINLPVEQRDNYRKSLREDVLSNHNLNNLIKKIVEKFV